MFTKWNLNKNLKAVLFVSQMVHMNERESLEWKMVLCQSLN